jgi:Uma2 family endonuclease
MTPATEVLKSPQLSPTPQKITFEEFLALYSNGEHVEWVDGEVQWLHGAPGDCEESSMTAASLPHVRLQMFLAAILEEFAKTHGLGVVVIDPFVMRMGQGLPGRAPDIAFVKTENAARLRPTFIDGPADLVVEIVSRDDPGRDYIDKYREYEAAGVTEYWIIDPEAQRTEFNQLRDGKYHEVLPDEDGAYHSAQLPGLWIKPVWFWQEPLPGLIEILREWKLI